MTDETKHMRPHEFLLLRGWEQHVLEEVAAQYGERETRMRSSGYTGSLLHPLRIDLYRPGCGAVALITSEQSRIAEIHL